MGDWMNHIRIPEDLSKDECRRAVELCVGGLGFKDAVCTAIGVPMEWCTLIRDGEELREAEILYFNPFTTRAG